MSNIKKLMMSAAGGGEALNVEDVFSTYLYTGNRSPQTITNGVPLSNLGFGTSTEFDGVNDYLYKTSDLTGNTNSSTFTFSAWVYHTGTVGMLLFASSTGGKIEWILNDPGNGSLNLTMESPNGTARFNVVLNNAIYPGKLYHILVSANMANTSQRHVYINDAPWTNLTWYSYVNTAIDFTHTNWWIGSNQGSSQYWPGRMSHFYLDYTYRDLSIEANRRLFIDANGGSTPPSTLSALSPKIYLPMTEDYSIGQNLGTGGNFTANDSPTIVQTGTEYVEDSTEGGLVWVKRRGGGSGNWSDNWVFDSVRGDSNGLRTNLTNSNFNIAPDNFGFSATGFNVPDYIPFSETGTDYATWTFRKAPKFFDVVTFEITRDGSNNLTSTSSNVTITNGEVTVDHNLEVAPAIWIQKNTTSASAWYVRSTLPGTVGGYAQLNGDNAWAAVGNWTFPSTATQVGFGDYGFFQSGTHTYVAYLFANNDGDGGFGPNGDADIIKCGSYTYSNGLEVNVGFEPQWLLYKQASTTGHWRIVDNMRGWGVPSTEKFLYPSLSNTEADGGQIDLTSTGFRVHDAGTGDYIYMAIRRGTKVPESGTEVFDIDTESSTQPQFTSGFPVDTALRYYTPGGLNWELTSRLTQGKRLIVNQTSGEGSESAYQFDYMDGWEDTISSNSSRYSWMWKRAPGFFDVVAYTGDGTYPRNIAHNLSATPEMVIIKARNWSSGNWAVHHKDLGYSTVSYLDNVLGSANQPHFLTASDASTFTVGSATSFSNYSNSASYNYIAYLFATLAGVSKVGSYTGNGTSQTIDCGFTSGARFVLIKRTDSTGDWYVWDTERGIVAGNDPHLSLNTTAAEVTSDDSIDPDNSGFIVNQVSATSINASGGNYIFYAIA